MNEMDRIGDLIVPYLCERTGLSREQIERVLDAQTDFWDVQLRKWGFVIEEDDD